VSSSPKTKAEGVSSRRLDIQGLRALAVTAVVAFHANLFIPGGFLGVDIFFVISGFVITGMLLRELERNHRISLVDFYVRRIRRLTPALVVVLLFTIAMTQLPFWPILTKEQVFQTAIGSLLIRSNFVIAATTGGYFDLPAKSNPLLHTWSLSVEEQFYVVYPMLFVILFVWLSRKVFKTRTVAIILLATITLGSFALPLIPNLGDGRLAELAAGYYSPLPRVWQLGAGALLAFAPTVKVKPILTNVLGFVGLAIVAFGLWGIDETITYPGWATIISVAGTVALIYSGQLPGSLVAKVLSTRLPVFIGNISYSWYLWHWPILVIFGLVYPQHSNWAVLAALLSLVPAWLSYRFIETRYQHKREAHPLRTFSVAAVTIVAMVGGISGLTVANANTPAMSEANKLKIASDPTYAGRVAGCHVTISPAHRPANECLFNSKAAGTPLYLLGDSNADQFSDGLIAAGKTLGSSVRDATASGCPVIRGILVLSKNGNPKDIQKSSWTKACSKFANDTIDWLKTQPKGVVVLASTDGYYFEKDTALAADTKYLKGTYKTRGELMQAALDRTVADILATGQKVLLAQTIPQFDAPPYVYTPSNCSSATIIAGKCKVVMPRAFVDKIQAPSRAIVQAVAASHGVATFDIRNLLCTATECSTLVKGVYLYRDQTHISVTESKTLGPVFVAALKPLIG